MLVRLRPFRMLYYFSAVKRCKAGGILTMFVSKSFLCIVQTRCATEKVVLFIIKFLVKQYVAVIISYTSCASDLRNIKTGAWKIPIFFFLPPLMLNHSSKVNTFSFSAGVWLMEYNALVSRLLPSSVVQRKLINDNMLNTWAQQFHTVMQLIWACIIGKTL